jgi:hypothetical protein
MSKHTTFDPLVHVLVVVLVCTAQCSAEPDAATALTSFQQDAGVRQSGVRLLFGTMPTLEPKAYGKQSLTSADPIGKPPRSSLLRDAADTMAQRDSGLPAHLKAVQAWASAPNDANRKQRCELHQDFHSWHPHLCKWFLMHYSKPMLVKLINARGGPSAFCSDAETRSHHSAFCARVATMPPVMAVARPPAKHLSSSQAMGAILQDILDAVGTSVETTSRSKLLIQLPSLTTHELDAYRNGANFAEMTALEMFAVLLLSVAFIVMVAVMLVAICSHRLSCLNRAEHTSEIEKHLSLTSDCTI